MTSNKNKPQYKTLKVTLDNGSVVNVSRTGLQNLDALLDAQDRVIEKYVFEEGALGKLLLNEEFVADLKLICSLLPIVGSAGNTLDFEDIKDNWEQLVTLFMNGGFNPETRRIDQVTESEVSKLHFLPYGKMLDAHLKSYRELQLQKEPKE